MKHQLLKKMNKKKTKIIISGGGTGGHIFPAISIANAVKEKEPETEILFVGALGKMEMEKVPAAGYQIIGLPITGIQRKLTFKNVVLIFKLISSLIKAKRIIKSFKPDVAVGVGGYASGPLLKAANRQNVPTLLQEQNSYAGVTNKLLAQKASKICVAYKNMDKFFPPEKILLTGNPVRKDILSSQADKKAAAAYFGIPEDAKVILSLGGSLGARTINQSILNSLDKLAESNTWFIWQTGKIYYEEAKQAVEEKNIKNVLVNAFINRMDLAYVLADTIISRAGAGTISELCLVGKPVILVPSPNVAEDHQTKNAMALVDETAAVLVKDNEAKEKLISEVLKLMGENKKREELATNIKKLAMPDSANVIADEVFKLIG